MEAPISTKKASHRRRSSGAPRQDAYNKIACGVQCITDMVLELRTKLDKIASVLDERPCSHSPSPPETPCVATGRGTSWTRGKQRASPPSTPPPRGAVDASPEVQTTPEWWPPPGPLLEMIPPFPGTARATMGVSLLSTSPFSAASGLDVAAKAEPDTGNLPVRMAVKANPDTGNLPVHMAVVSGLGTQTCLATSPTAKDVPDISANGATDASMRSIDKAAKAAPVPEPQIIAAVDECERPDAVDVPGAGSLPAGNSGCDTSCHVSDDEAGEAANVLQSYKFETVPCDGRVQDDFDPGVVLEYTPVEEHVAPPELPLSGSTSDGWRTGAEEDEGDEDMALTAAVADNRRTCAAARSFEGNDEATCSETAATAPYSPAPSFEMLPVDVQLLHVYSLLHSLNDDEKSRGSDHECDNATDRTPHNVAPAKARRWTRSYPAMPSAPVI